MSIGAFVRVAGKWREGSIVDAGGRWPYNAKENHGWFSAYMREEPKLRHALNIDREKEEGCHLDPTMRAPQPKEYANRKTSVYKSLKIG